MFKKIATVLIVFALVFTGYLFLQANQSAKPSFATSNLPVSTTQAMPHQLKPCPDKQNCVSTQATDDKKRDPISYVGSQEDARQKLLTVLDAMPRTTRVAADEDYVHYTFKTWPIPFTDDVEFVFDDAKKLIHYRSASRVGYSDLGVNGKRMAKIVAAYIK